MEKLKRVHFIGVCGYLMSAAAAMLARLGYQVSGSDDKAYPPGTEIVDQAGIKRFEKYSARHLGQVDLVVIGNQIEMDNPEARKALAGGFQVVSVPQLISQLFHDKQRLVVAGTHGKSTTAALISWCLEQAGFKPSYLIGGLMRNTGLSFQLGQGDYLVIEGDEYRTSFFDQQPKFLHYQPHIAVVTNCELDHPDFFTDLPAVKKVFEEFLNLVPGYGLAVFGVDDSAVAELASKFKKPKLTYGFNHQADYRGIKIQFGAATRFQVQKKGKNLAEFQLTLPGEINVQNALAAIAVVDYLKVDLAVLKKAVADFQGVGRRLEIVGRPKGVTVIDDYAHHPTQIRQVLAAVRRRYPQGKIYAVFEPHTYSRTKALLAGYAGAFGAAEAVVIAPLLPARESNQPAAISSEEVVRAISHYQQSVVFLDQEEKIISHLLARIKSKDIVIIMSVGGRHGLARRIVDAIQAK